MTLTTDNGLVRQLTAKLHIDVIDGEVISLLKIRGILPRHRTVQTLMVLQSVDGIHLAPLYGPGRGVRVCPAEWNNFVQSVPAVFHSTDPSPAYERVARAYWKNAVSKF